MSINVEKLVERHTSETYPNIVVSSPNETTPVIVKTLEKGDMQLIVEFNGKRKVVERISRSAYNVDRLLRTVGTINYQPAPDISLEVSDIATYLGCVM